MKISELLTSENMEKVAEQAQANAMVLFQDQLWKTLDEKAPDIIRSTGVDPESPQMKHLMMMFYEISKSSYEAGSIIGAQQAIIVLLSTLKQAEVG